MRDSKCWRWLLVAGAALAPVAARAQTPEGPLGVGVGSPNVAPDFIQAPLPLYSQRPEAGGLYTAAEFVFMHQTRPVRDQTIMVRGFFDSTGFITGQPGTFVGSGEPALTTGMLGRTSWEPGYRAEIGYRFANGLAISVSTLRLLKVSYNAGATLVTPFFRANPNLAETFITAPVFNFPVDFAGPPVKTVFDLNNPTTIGPNNISTHAGSNLFGIWNGASEATEKYQQHYEQYDITGRVPVYSNDFARLYGLVGGRHAWLWERFAWRTVSRDINGGAGPDDAADYTNLISNRMTGPFIGCGQECYLGGGFALSGEATTALLIDRVREKASYERDDVQFTGSGSKDARMEYRVVPNINGNCTLWWYPIQGVQLRFSYNSLMYFNTVTSKFPVGFNYSKIDAPYETQWFRWIHGFTVGAGISF
jgi:hypothetical protein